MRIVLLILLSLLSTPAKAQLKNPYSALKFDKVVFYDFQLITDRVYYGSILSNDGKPIQRIVKQVQLDESTVKKLNIKLGDKKSYGAGTAACFEPHCGFVYFLKGKPVEQITICLDCNGLHSGIEIPAQKQGKMGEGKDTYYFLMGLSKSFRQFINALVIENKFSHQIKPGSSFDK